MGLGPGVLRLQRRLQGEREVGTASGPDAADEPEGRIARGLDLTRFRKEGVCGVVEGDHVDAVARAQATHYQLRGRAGLVHGSAAHAPGSIDHQRDVLRTDLPGLHPGGCGHLQDEIWILPRVTVDDRGRLPGVRIDLQLQDQIAYARGLGKSADARVSRVGSLHLQRVALGVDPRERVIVDDLRNDVALAAGERQPVLQATARSREPLAEADLYPLPLARLDGKDVEGEASLPCLLQQARIPALAHHVVVEVARGLLLEDLADDLLLAVPVGEALDGGAGRAQDVAAFQPLIADVLELLLEHGLRVLVIDADAHALGNGPQIRARAFDAALEQDAPARTRGLRTAGRSRAASSCPGSVPWGRRSALHDACRAPAALPSRIPGSAGIYDR